MMAMTRDALAVIALRTAKIARGGKAGEAESRKMVNEKIRAGMELGAKAMTGGLGRTPETALKKTLALYGPKVKANRKRLSKW